jgi:hypothetical protein
MACRDEKETASAWTESAMGKYELDCPLAHNLINKLSVIVRTCDLLVEKAPEDSRARPKMLLIRNIARSRRQTSDNSGGI